MHARFASLGVAFLVCAACENGNNGQGAGVTTSGPPSQAVPAAEPGSVERTAGAPEAVSNATLTSAALEVKQGKLSGKTIAILATNGVEADELLKPRLALADQGAQTVVVSSDDGLIQAFNHADRGPSISVDQTVAQADASKFDGLLLPGGVRNPDELRQDPKAVAFVRAFVNAGKPIAAICHGPWMLIEANDVRGKTLTSFPSLKTDIRNAGGTWVDQAVVDDHGIVTSRKPEDIPAFDAKMIEEFSKKK